MQENIVTVRYRDIGLEPAPQFTNLPKGYNAYAIECLDGTYYIGMTNSLRHRITQYCLGIGSRWTRSHGFKRLVAYWPAGGLEEALLLEREMTLRYMTGFGTHRVVGSDWYRGARKFTWKEASAVLLFLGGFLFFAIQVVLGLMGLVAALILTIYSSVNPTFKRIEEIEREAASRKPKERKLFLIWREL